MKKVGKSIIYILLAVVAFVWVYPFIWMITASLKTQDEFFASGLSLIPKSLNFENYVRAVSYTHLKHGNRRACTGR